MFSVFQYFKISAFHISIACFLHQNQTMDNSWLDILPSSERQKIREKYRLSAAAYEKLREKVKGPEDLREEMIRNEIMARLRFGLETEPALKDALKKQIEKDITEKGIEAVLSSPGLPDILRQLLESGRFDVTVASPSEHEPDQLVVVPEGNVQEKLPVHMSLTNAYLSQLQA